MTVTGITIVVMSVMKMTGGGEGMTMTIVMAMTVVGMLRTDCSVPGLAQPAGRWLVSLELPGMEKIVSGTNPNSQSPLLGCP